ncbi:MAG: hypothetical protein LBF27_05910 [Sphingobacterium sp.]|jgi:hypothetical protein|nr:hypothetical protein [Sphingobacterium sp.]
MEKELPIYKDQGIEFIVDIDKLEFREKANQNNRYGFEVLEDRGEEGYQFEHYNEAKDETLWITTPQFVTLDPEGMAEKYKKSIEEVYLLTDFELMVDQELLTKRLKDGQLPTIELAGHIFYADARIDLLRPKDDFSKRGMRFDELENYYYVESNSYCIVYNPNTHDIGQLDYENITDIPKDLLFVEIPDVKVLDPVGWNRRNGFPETDDLKRIGLKLEFAAKIIPWKETGIDELIAKNRLKNPIMKAVAEKKPGSQKRGGPKM